MRRNLIKRLVITSNNSRTINSLQPSAILSREFHSIKDNRHSWSVLNNIYRKDFTKANQKYACFLLNISDESYKIFENYRSLWNDSDFRVAVDGSANCLAKRRVIHTADVVCGDFDSIDNKLIEELRCPNKSAKLLPSKGKLPQVIETPSQKETDFTKALHVAIRIKPEIQFFFGICNWDGSRIDHMFGLVNTLHLVKKNIVLVNVRSNTVLWLLQPGIHVIQKPKGKELCSMVPFTGKTEVKTQGLVYDLTPSTSLSFGGLISTSNICSEDSSEITIETNRELLWSIDLSSGERKRDTI